MSKIYKPTPEELKEILTKHRKWWLGEDGGERANLRSADLRSADLRSANLVDADLRSANLVDADLRSANLGGANLGGANLGGADLGGADLRGADLRGADLRGADLRGADLRSADLPAFQIVPQEGSFIGFKKTANAVLKLLIPDDAQRTGTLVGRKCRASKVKVLEVVKGEDTEEALRGLHQPSLIYKVGKVIEPDAFDADIRVECTHGIHFFLTKGEAEQYT